MKRMILLCLIPGMFSGCYCFREFYNTEVKNLEGKKYGTICCVEVKPECKPFLVNTYYGLPNTKRNSYENTYKPESASSSDIGTFGPLGFRIEKYVIPSRRFPVRILGLGLDYSYASSTLSYQRSVNNTTTTYRNELRFTDHRIMASANLILLAKRKMTGYSTLQCGALFSNRNNTGNDPDFAFKTQKPLALEYRAGFGLQYYLNGKFALVAEGGYGGGAYARAGFCYWLEL